MGLADDFLQLPTGLKLLVGDAILLGAAIQLPLINISIGAIIFSPFIFIIGFFGVFITFELFVVFYNVILLLAFIYWITGILHIKFSTR